MGASFNIRDDDLRELESKLSDPRRVLEDVARNLAEEAVNLTREGWDGQHDPYGQGWQAKKRPDGRAILVGESGTLRTSWIVVKQGADGFTIASAKSYAVIHQKGAPRAGIVPRMMVPREDDIAPPWMTRFDEVADEVIDSHLGR